MPATFESFALHPDLLRGVAKLGFTTPTPVQEHAIPLLLEGKDAIVLAKTGSGKTLAFGLPIMSLLDPAGHPQALVVVPTRELALQVCEALASVAESSPLKTLALFGGVSIGPQEDALRRGADIIVGTPGRLKDHMGRGSLDLRRVGILVLDEADEMLDMGFRRDIEFLLDRLPGRKQTLLFSATMPDAIETIARKHMHTPEIVRLTSKDPSPSEISHHFVRVAADRRVDALVALLETEAPSRAIVFTRTKHETKRLAQRLERLADIKAGYLNGNMSQNARNTMMARFKSGELPVLVATDVAARGIDVEGLSHVFHFAVPTVVETYMHRSGRTGRAGNEGKTIIMVTPDSESDFKAITRKVSFSELKVDLPAPNPNEEPLDARPPRQDTRRGRAPRAQQEPRAQAPAQPREGRAERRVEQASDSRRPRGPRQAEPAAAPRRDRDAAAAAPRRDDSRNAGRSTGTRNLDAAALLSAAPARRTATGPMSPLPRYEVSWRSFKLALKPGNRPSKENLHAWLSQRTGIPRSALRSIQIHADHATLEVDSRNAERFLEAVRGLQA